jgi:hypothetical protein
MDDSDGKQETPKTGKLLSGESGEPGDIYEQAAVKTVAGFFRGNSTHLFGITRFGVPGVYIRAGSSQLSEVVWPQSPRTEPGHHTPLGAEMSKVFLQFKRCLRDVEDEEKRRFRVRGWADASRHRGPLNRMRRSVCE